MRLFVNGEERRVAWAEEESLEERLARFQAESLARGETVLAVSVDGVDLDEARTERGPVRVGDVTEVGLTVASLRSLVEETLAEAADYAARLGAALAEAAAALQRGDVADGTGLLSETLDGLGWLQQVLDRLAGLAEQGRAPWIAGEDAADLRRWGDGMVERVAACCRALESGDLVLVADRLEFDLAEWLAGLSGGLDEVGRRLGTGA